MFRRQFIIGLFEKMAINSQLPFAPILRYWVITWIEPALIWKNFGGTF